MTLARCAPTLCLLVAVLLSPRDAVVAQENEAYKPYGEGDVETSPKKPWGEFPLTVTEDHGGHPWWADVLLWVPNRVLDLIDVFHADVGVGPSAGAVVRVTEYGQVGYREMMPFSFRVGDFGRQLPVVIETSDEYGVGPGFVSSKSRDVCTAEFGLGLDVFVAGAYAGICADELADFVGGLFFIDFKHDDM